LILIAPPSRLKLLDLILRILILRPQLLDARRS